MGIGKRRGFRGEQLTRGCDSGGLFRGRPSWVFYFQFKLVCDLLALEIIIILIIRESVRQWVDGFYSEGFEEKER